MVFDFYFDGVTVKTGKKHALLGITLGKFKFQLFVKVTHDLKLEIA